LTGKYKKKNKAQIVRFRALTVETLHHTKFIVFRKSVLRYKQRDTTGQRDNKQGLQGKQTFKVGWKVETF
jgi:hypothetical protein